MDPLRFINTSQGTQGVNRFVPISPSPGAANQPGFKDVLLKNLNEVNNLQVDANRALEDLQTGQGSLENVILATQKADTAFRLLQGLRNKVVEAYDEVKQIRV